MDEGEQISVKSSEKLHAFLCMVLVQPSEESKSTSGLLIVGDLDSLSKGVVLEVGGRVEELQEGDLIFFDPEKYLTLEKGIWAVHYEDVVAYKRYE